MQNESAANPSQCLWFGTAATDTPFSLLDGLPDLKGVHGSDYIQSL